MSDAPAREPASEAVAVGFARALRDAGLDVAVSSTLAFVEALAAVGVAQASAVYWAGRATLVRRRDDVPTYDRLFDQWWRSGAPSSDSAGAPPALIDLAFDEPTEEGHRPERADTPDRPWVAVRWSRAEVLRHRDFAAYTPSEHAESRRLMADLRLAGALRPSRRRQPGRRGQFDLRRSVQRTLRASGELVPPALRERGARTRRVVLLCDVSGSMEPYARALVRFAHAAVVGRGRVEVFALGTRCTRITRELSSHDPDAALAAAAGRVADWSGGTRLGEGLREFNSVWGVRGMARGATVVILSDGWDRGDANDLAEQMARLRRVANRIVWVNPLKASPGFEPTAKGMAAALPFVDELVEGHSLASLEQLVDVIAT